MNFNLFQKELTDHINATLAKETTLFTLDANPYKLWELYLESFPVEYNGIYRERRTHDCNACSIFVRRLGNVAAILDDKVVTIWDFIPTESAAEFGPSVAALREYLHSKPISGVFLSDANTFGVASNTEYREDGPVIEWHHLHAKLPKLPVTAETEKGGLRSTHQASHDVFTRSLEEISVYSVEVVLELIAASNLYKGEEWTHALQSFKGLSSVYSSLPSDVDPDAWVWRTIVEVSPVVSRLRNHSMGTLLVDISSGTDLTEAVKKYEKMVAPENYKRSKGVFTKSQVEKAEQTVDKLNLRDALQRRFARIDDLSVNDILFANRDAARKVRGSVFDDLVSEAKSAPISIERASEISVEDFISDVLPRASSVELLVHKSMEPNFMSLIAPKVRGAAPLFRWDNGFSWAYNGNITDSSMKDRVKALGGNTKGDLRFTIQWNEEGDNKDDYDAHCKEPAGGVHISFPKKGRRQLSSGMLDVDIQNPGNKVAVENIIYTDKSRMPLGEYQFLVHNYCHRGGQSGFRAEVEFDGQIYSFDYPKAIRHGGVVHVASVDWDGEKFTCKSAMDPSLACGEIWGKKVGVFHPVSVAMLSPNYWNEATKSGHRHLFLMLEGCTNPASPNGFFNEFLRNDLLEHRQVFEVLGGKMRVEPDEQQLSGVGFSMTKNNSFGCRVKGASTKVMKVMV